MRQVKALLPVRARELRFVEGMRVTVRRLLQVGQKRSIVAVGPWGGGFVSLLLLLFE